MLRGITVLAGERPLVEGLDATFAPGRLTAVTGPSGAGKSTLLRVLAGVVTPAAGEATLGGVPVRELSDEARLATLSLVPQGLGVLPATVRENLLLARPGAGDEECREALFRAQLGPDSGVGLDTNARELSGGQRQRVALARAFLADAPCLLVDEPTSALDRATGEAVWAELERLAHEQGKTVVAVTHDAALAARADVECRVQPATHAAARDESKGSAR
nr:ATP-binding cassette domain-containing protein [Leucobacter chinensis]